MLKISQASHQFVISNVRTFSYHFILSRPSRPARAFGTRTEARFSENRLLDAETTNNNKRGSEKCGRAPVIGGIKLIMPGPEPQCSHCIGPWRERRGATHPRAQSRDRTCRGPRADERANLGADSPRGPPGKINFPRWPRDGAGERLSGRGRFFRRPNTVICVYATPGHAGHATHRIGS